MAHGPVFSDAESARAIDPTAGRSLPVISESLNSVRAYSWECHFTLPDVEIGNGATFDRPLVLAAKTVSEAGFAVGDIEVNRVNDKVFYPGRPEQDDLTITFDNLYQDAPGITLWEWFKSIYDPITGEMTKKTTEGLPFKAQQLEVLQLNNSNQPISSTKFFGVYPKSWKGAEYNYGTSEFHTISVVFKYDFMDHGFHGHSTPRT